MKKDKEKKRKSRDRRRNLEKSIILASIGNLLNTEVSVRSSQVNDRDVFTVRNFGETGTLGLRSDILFRHGREVEAGGQDLGGH